MSVPPSGMASPAFIARLRRMFCTCVGSPKDKRVLRLQIEYEFCFLVERMLKKERNVRDQFVNVEICLLEFPFSSQREQLRGELGSLRALERMAEEYFSSFGLSAENFCRIISA